MPKSTKTSHSKQVKPEPGLEKRTRRTYNAEYKMSIIAQADACKHGEVGALLRRERLYSNQLSAWRRELAQSGLAGLSKTVPGPKPSKTSEQRQIEQLEKANVRLTRELEIANGCLDLQKKALSMLDHLNSGSDV
ncbi:MAG: transposase [Rhizobiales bacterium]|nr:transposase [Hyphomicrobiales bacterium]